MKTVLKWLAVILILLPAYGFAQEEYRDTLFVHNAVLSGLSTGNIKDSTIVINKGIIYKASPVQAAIDTFYIKYVCNVSIGEAWVFSGDTVMIDTCYSDSTSMSVIWTRVGGNIYSTNTGDNILVRGTNKLMFKDVNNYIYEDGSGIYGVTISGQTGITMSLGSTKMVTMKAGTLRPVTDSAVSLGSGLVQWNDGYFDGIVYTDGLELQDGTQGAGKVLVSDARGNASWGILTDTSKWTKVGNYLYPDNLSDNVGIGIGTPMAKLSVNGNIHITDTNSIYFNQPDKYIKKIYDYSYGYYINGGFEDWTTTYPSGWAQSAPAPTMTKDSINNYNGTYSAGLYHATAASIRTINYVYPKTDSTRISFYYKSSSNNAARWGADADGSADGLDSDGTWGGGTSNEFQLPSTSDNWVYYQYIVKTPDDTDPGKGIKLYLNAYGGTVYYDDVKIEDINERLKVANILQISDSLLIQSDNDTSAFVTIGTNGITLHGTATTIKLLRFTPHH